MRRDWASAREKVRSEGRCRACGFMGELDPAHIVPRSQVRSGVGEHPDNIVPLCRRCHGLFDTGTLDLLPFLRVEEQAKAVELHPGGMLGALRCVTNDRWEAA